MTLQVLEEAIQEAYRNLDQKDFSRMVKDARDAIGLKLYRAAEFVGIAPARMKNLESGYFRVMPTEAELKALAYLYDFKLSLLKRKAEEHVEARKRVLKVRTIRDDKDM